MKSKKQAMPIDDILSWFDSEIDFLDEEMLAETTKVASNAVTMLTLTGIKGYLNAMKRKLTDVAFEDLDKNG